MRTGGGYSRYNGDENDDGEDYDERRDRVNKNLQKDRKIINEANKVNDPIYKAIDHSSDNEYLRHIQKHRSKPNLESSQYMQEERKDDYLTMATGLRQDTAGLKYNPLASPEAKY